MSKYTTELRFVCETLAGQQESVPYSQTQQVIETARPKIFDFSYPIFDDEYKPVLETRILKHFYTREIGAETVGLWHLWLDETMNRIMPFYNKLYRSELLEFNPLYDVDVTRSGNRSGSSQDASNRTGTSRTVTDQDTTGRTVVDQDTGSTDTQLHWNLVSDTPQGSIANLDNNTYLTQAQKATAADSGTGTLDSTTNSTGTNDVTVTGSTTDAATSSGNTTEQYIEHVVGKQGSGSYSKMLEEFRNTFLRIDEMILEELEPLFMQLW